MSDLSRIEADTSNSTMHHEAQSRLSGEAMLELAAGHAVHHHTEKPVHHHQQEQSNLVFKADHSSLNGRAPYDWNDGSGYVLNLMLGYRRN